MRPMAIALMAGLGNAFTQTIEISTSSTGVDLRDLADTAGYPGSGRVNLIFNIPAGVTIKGAPSGVGLTPGAWPAGSHRIVVNVAGKLYGGGGNGGTGGMTSADPNGGNGGAAVDCTLPIDINVLAGGEIKGGGGGGGGGDDVYVPGGATPHFNGGDGGSGGFPNGLGGAGRPADAIEDPPTYAGVDGNLGSVAGGGAATATAGNSRGGAGGDAATAGSNGGAAFNQGDGGNAGEAIKKNGFVVNVTNAGTITGVVG